MSADIIEVVIWIICK